MILQALHLWPEHQQNVQLDFGNFYFENQGGTGPKIPDVAPVS